MTAITLYRIDPERNMSRFYRLDIQVDLFGVWCVVKEWGRIGRSGQTRLTAFDDVVLANAYLERQQLGKQRRGYVRHIGC